MQSIPKIFVINLKRSTDRRAYVEKHLRELGLSFEFFDAVDGRLLTEEEKKSVDFELAKEVCGHELSLTEAGCALSHINLYKYLMENDIRQAIVMEDDIICPPFTKEIFEKFIRVKPERCELGYFNHGKAKNWFIGRKLLYGYKLHRLHVPTKSSKRNVMQTACYYITKSGCEKLLKIAFPVRQPSDYLLGFVQRNGLNCYLVEPEMVSQSTIPPAIDDRTYRR